MKNILFFCVMLLNLCFISQGQAAALSQFSCPTTFRFVTIGDSMATVKAHCGEPSSVTKENQQGTKVVPLQLWYYRVGTVKENTSLTLKFTIKNRKVSNILLEGRPVGGTNLCLQREYPISSGGGTYISIGDSAFKVRSICGEPAVDNKSSETVTTGNEKVQTWLYDFGRYQPKISMIFKNGVLSSIDSQPVETRQ